MKTHPEAISSTPRVQRPASHHHEPTTQVSRLALQLPASDHRDRRAEAPPELRAVDLLTELDLARAVELVPEAQERVLERQVEAPLGAALKLVHERLVRAPARAPRCGPGADGLGELAERCDVHGRGERLRGGREEGVEAVVEVGEEENLAVRERLEQRWLVYTVEGAGLHLADSVRQNNTSQER